MEDIQRFKGTLRLEYYPCRTQVDAQLRSRHVRQQRISFALGEPVRIAHAHRLKVEKAYGARCCVIESLTMSTSIRNRLPGTIERIVSDNVVSELTIKTAAGDITSIITTGSVKR